MELFLSIQLSSDSVTQMCAYFCCAHEYMQVYATYSVSVLELKSSTSDAAGQSPAAGPPSHAVTFHYPRAIPIKLTAKSVK